MKTCTDTDCHVKATLDSENAVCKIDESNCKEVCAKPHMDGVDKSKCESDDSCCYHANSFKETEILHK